MWRMLGADDPMEAHKVDSRAIFELGQSGEAVEGVTSFLEKRSPSFPGKVSKDMPSFFHGGMKKNLSKYVLEKRN